MANLVKHRTEHSAQYKHVWHVYPKKKCFSCPCSGEFGCTLGYNSARCIHHCLKIKAPVLQVREDDQKSHFYTIFNKPCMFKVGAFFLYLCSFFFFKLQQRHQSLGFTNYIIILQESTIQTFNKNKVTNLTLRVPFSKCRMGNPRGKRGTVQ